MLRAIYLAISFMRFNALPALNQVICKSLNEWLSLILSDLPSACLISASTCLPGAKLANPKMEILDVGVILNKNNEDKYLVRKTRQLYNKPYRNQLRWQK